MRGRGFTLLEVLVAISILGLGLTVILSSQVGLFSSSSRTANLTVATNLARCRMNEVEVELQRTGYPLIDSKDEGPCCEDESFDGFRCEWRIERIELPEPSSFDGDGGDGLSADTLGPLGALSQGGSSLGFDGGLSGVASALGESAEAAQGGGIAAMLFGMVYPGLKPMLEASIRKVTVSVLWKEGRSERDFSVTQYVTNPQQGGIDEGLGGLDGGVPGFGTQGGLGTPGAAPGGGR